MSQISPHVDEITATKPKNNKKMKTVDRNLYAVEITEVDKARKRVKIHFTGYHFTGYSEKFDEWRPWDES